MSDQNRLADIRIREADRLLSEAMSQLADQQTEITRLRGALGRLEWAGGRRVHPTRAGSCPACQRLQPAGHRGDCWLAKELAGNDEEAPTEAGASSTGWGADLHVPPGCSPSS